MGKNKMSSTFTKLVSQHTCLTIICVNNEQKSPIQLNYTCSLTQFREITLTRIKSSAFFENKHTHTHFIEISQYQIHQK